MPLVLTDIKKYHDKSFISGQVNRERAADDIVFYWVTHWDDNSLAESQLGFRGEFDQLRKAGRDIMADLDGTPVQVDFEPVDEGRDDGAELLDGLYRRDNNDNASIEAFDNADQEAIVAGVGAWLLQAVYETTRGGNVNQVIKRLPIWEANNTVYWDPNARMIDKSDADYVSVLTAYSEDGYKKLFEEMTGEDFDGNWENFKSPEQSYAFPWIGGEGRKIYVDSFYHREMVKDKQLVMLNPLGQSVTLLESSLDEFMDQMLDDGFTIESEKEVERWQVTKYICSGKEILNGEMVDGERVGEVIAGENIPVVPEYGEHAWIEGEEHYEGVTRLAKDPQRLRDFAMSYLADIMSRSPREKPIFFQEQIAGFEDMYDVAGSENNFPYLLQNRLGGDGSQLPVGPPGTLPAPTIPPALGAVIDLTRQAIEDVANPGVPQNMADSDLSGKAVLALQAKIDKQSAVYQKHRKHARRRDGVIYASMAAEIYDVPRSVKVELPDGTRQEMKVMETVIDDETGELLVINDINNQEFNVYSKIGSDYSSQKEQTLERMQTMVVALPPGDPMRQALMLKSLKLMDGVDFDDIREYANNQLVLSGIRKPETDEEKELLAQASQKGQEPSAEMVLAQAEVMKGQAAQDKNQIEVMKVQSGSQNEQMKRMIDEFKAATDRMNTQIDAQEAGAKINMTNVETFGKDLDNQQKVVELQKPRSVEDMDDDELFQLIQTG